MCVSAEVSFALSGTLLWSGAFCVRRARHVDPTLLPLASVPVVFGVQQFCEGCVWTGIMRGDTGMTHLASMCYLFFALGFWPVWIPYCAMRLERRKKIRTLLRVAAGLGAVLGLSLLVPLLAEPGRLEVSVWRHSVHYGLATPVFNMLPSMAWQFMYFALVAMPLLVSQMKRLIYFGLAVVLSAATTHIFFDHNFLTFWCFFAAALSAFLCVLFWKMPVATERQKVSA